MIKHIVIWRLKEHAEGADKMTNAQKIKRDLEALNGRIPGLIKLEIGLDFSCGEFSGDIILYSELASKQALADYQVHPEHKAAGTFVVACTAERRVVDYEI